MDDEPNGRGRPAPLVEALTLRLGLALHRYGTPAHQLEDDMSQVSRRFGVSGQFLSTPTYITAAFDSPGGTPRVHVVRTQAADIDLGKLRDLHATASDVVGERLSLAEGLVAIDRILVAPPAWGPVIFAAAYGLTSASVARLLGGGIIEMVLAGGIGLVVGSLSLVASRRAAWQGLLEMAAAVVCTLVAAAASQWVIHFSMPIATLAALIVLLPGMALTTAMTELATGNLVSGTARLSGAGVSFLKLGLGVALGTKLGGLLFSPAILLPRPHSVGWSQWPATALAAMALGVVLQARRRDLPAILAVCMLGHMGAELGAWSLGGELGSFVAALVTTLGSRTYAHLSGHTPTVTQAPAILLLVPGSVGYRAVTALMQREVVMGMQIAFSAALTAMALVAGVLLANLLFPPRLVR